MAPDSLNNGLQVAECQTLGGDAREALLTLRQLRELPRLLGDDPRIDYYEARAHGALSDNRPALEPVGRAGTIPIPATPAAMIETASAAAFILDTVAIFMTEL